MTEDRAKSSLWVRDYHWPDAGEEWSREWGSSRRQWHATILPRILDWIPVGTLLEIGPGHGRWTRFLLQNCARYIGVDDSADAVAQCRARFCFETKAEFVVNDGVSLPGVGDRSVDFLFSMDSLVHSEVSEIEPYVAEFSRVLSDRGSGFIHHSNMADHPGRPNPHTRAPTVNAESFRALCEKAGLACIVQEKVNWGAEETNDCFTLFVRRSGRPHARPAVVDNTGFRAEVANSGRIASLYGRPRRSGEQAD